MTTKNVLFINACVREQSRTKRLADHLLSYLPGEKSEVRISEISFPNVDETFLRQRDALLSRQELLSPMFVLARDFAAADVIVIAAPFWDLSFPAALKQYFEQVNVNGITFQYTEEGIPQGLCHAKKLYYVTTAGGPIYSDEYGFGYVKALAQNFYGIPDVLLIKAEGLDIVGADVEEILQKTKQEIDTLEFE